MGKRRPLRYVVGGVCLVVLAFLALAAYDLNRARERLVRGADELQAARALISPLARWKDPAVRAQVRGDLGAANRDFGEARGDLAAWRPVLKRLGWMPGVGGQLASAPDAADAAFYATRAALRVMDGLAPVWGLVSAPTPKGSLVPRLLPVVGRGRGDFADALADVKRADAAVAGLPARSGNASLDSAVRRLREAIPGMRAGLEWLLVVPQVLGGEGASRYLLLFQDPAELRPTGGFIGAVDLLSADNGRIVSHFSDSTLPHEIDSVLPPLPESFFTPEGYWLLRDANYSPDFPLSARIARWFYGEDTGTWVQGVIGINDFTIADLLAATGPVYVPRYGRTVDAEDVVRLAQEYVRQSGALSPGGRKGFLGAVFSALLGRLEMLPLSRWEALGQALSRAVSHHDVLLFDRRPAVERAIKGSGADGRLRYGGGDYLSVVDDNLSYNKLNPYVRESGEYTADVRGNLTIEGTLRIHYRVLPSPADLDGAGPEFGLLGSKHDYQDFIRVYVPPGSRLLSLKGLTAWPPVRAYGMTQFSGRLLLREGRARMVTVRYVIPANALVGGDASSYVLHVRSQPGGNLRSLTVRIGGPGVPVPVETHLTLDIDRTVRAQVHGTARPTTVVLRPASGPIDPYIPFGSFHDRHHRL